MNSPAASEPDATGRWADILSGRLGMYTLALNLGTTLFAISTFVVVSIMPTAAADIGGLRYYAWTFALFSVGSVIGAAGTGPVREAHGHRKTFIGAGLVFVIGLFGAGLAPNMETVVFWRLIQGTGGGAIAAQGYALIAQMYPEHLRGRALSTLSTAWGVATILGPAFGGVFAEFGNWRGAFYALGGLGLVFAYLAYRVVPESEAGHGRVRFPVTRLALLAASVLGLSATSQFDDNMTRAVLVVVSVLIAAIAFRRDAGAEQNLFPRQAVNLGTEMGLTFWVMMLITMSMVIINLYVTLYLQKLHGITPLAAAYIYVINSMAWSTVAFVIASWEGRKEAAAIVIGLTMLVIGLAGLAYAAATGPVSLIAGLLVVTGSGMGLLNNPLIRRAIAVAPEEERARTGSSVQSLRTAGHSFGAAVAGLVAAVAGLTDDAAPEILGPAMQWVYGTGTAFPALALILAIFLFAHGRRRLAEGN
ncbi:MAG: MFS transporter [Rhodospirillales bacterium]|nr:MFS transporter [Rhodospirillales bacterium]